MIQGKIIQLIPAPERLFEPNPTGIGGSMEPTNLLCLALTNEGEILLVTNSGQTANYWTNGRLKVVKPDARFERNDN